MLYPKEHFGQITKQRIALNIQFPSGFCNIVSVTNFDKNTTAGSTAEVSISLAAKCIINGTHRLMTDDELTALKSAQAVRRQHILAEERTSLRRRISGSLGG